MELIKFGCILVGKVLIFHFGFVTCNLIKDHWQYTNIRIPKNCCFSCDFGLFLFLLLCNVFLNTCIFNQSVIFLQGKAFCCTELLIKWALDKFNIIPQLFPKKVGIFIPLEVLAWVMTACRVLRSRLTYFLRNMNISSIFYFPKSTSINTQYSRLWGTLKMMLFTKYLIKWKRIGRISWNFRFWFDFKSSIERDIKR